MPSRRRSREARRLSDRHERRRARALRAVDEPTADEPPATRSQRVEARRTAEHVARVRRITRLRTFVGALGFLPLLAALACGGAAIPLLCDIPREWYLGIWAGVFGSFLGLTIRLFLERRAFRRGES